MAYFVTMGITPEHLFYLQGWSGNFIAAVRVMVQSEVLEQRKRKLNVALCFNSHVKRGRMYYELS